MRIVVAEDQFLLREGITRLLQAHGCDIAAAVGDGPALLQALVSERPDVAIVDVRLPPTFTDEGLRAALEARRQVPGLPVLVLSQYVEQLYARELLADRGLAAAVQALALGSPLPAETDIQLPGRPPAPVESAVYFAVAEALTNAVKHSGASRLHIRVAYRAGMLRIEVTDDGHGGADPANGTGLLGVERRVATFDGILAVSSPPGGPTIVVIEVPCALSSPKTSSS